VASLVSSRVLRPAGDTRQLLIKWIVALLVPLAVFTFVWSGEAIVNNVLLGLLAPAGASLSPATSVLAGIFVLVFYATVLTLSGYLIAADSGRRGTVELWIDILVFVLVPLLLIMTAGLVIGLAISVLVWVVFFYVRNRIRKARGYKPLRPAEALTVVTAEEREAFIQRAVAGGFWFGTIFALISLVVDLIFYFSGQLPDILLVWVIVRTILLPIAGYFLGRLGGSIALRHVLAAANDANEDGTESGIEKKKQLEVLSSTRAREEAKDLVPNDLPLRSSGAQRFYLTLLTAFILFYPILDPFLFGSGTGGRLAGYTDAGYYVILALGLNIVVGFAGLLDLGYVAFFAIGSYTWSIVGSTQLATITGITLSPATASWLFWPMLLVTALVAALFGVLLGAPTLRLRGDYLAIVTLGFGEIVPVVFLELDKYTNGANGIVGVQSPALNLDFLRSVPVLSGLAGLHVEWSNFTPIPYYYLIIALIVLVIFANLRLRDSRIGRAWIAIREDEIAAASSGVNLVNTKLFAFAAGAFFSGIAGAYHAAKLGQVSPDAFSFGDSVIYLAMVVIGGLGSIPGVIVGAFAVYAINQLILAQLDTLASDPTNVLHTVFVAITQVIPGFTFGNIRNLVFGAILVAVMIFRPEGFLPSSRRRRELHHSEDQGVEVSSLDVIPGAPGFEEEIRVE
jgi:ABC-type branched-subunit amino acid transport system permease subunit